MAGNIGCSALVLSENITAPELEEGHYAIFSDSNDNRIKIKHKNDSTIVISDGGDVVNFQEITFVAPLNDALDSPYYLLGNISNIANRYSIDDNTVRTLFGNNLSIDVTSLNGSGIVTITGSLVDNDTGVVTKNATETFTIDEIGTYLSTGRWYKISSIIFSAGIKSIIYNIDSINMYNKSTSNIEIIGLIIDIIALSNSSSRSSSRFNKNQSIQFQLFKIQDDGNNKYSKKTIEDITINTSGITDNLRTDDNNRSDTVDFFVTTSPHHFKFNDYVTYYDNKTDNYINSSEKNEGIILKLTWSRIDVFNLILRFRPI